MHRVSAISDVPLQGPMTIISVMPPLGTSYHVRWPTNVNTLLKWWHHLVVPTLCGCLEGDQDVYSRVVREGASNIVVPPSVRGMCRVRLLSVMPAAEICNFPFAIPTETLLLFLTLRLYNIWSRRKCGILNLLHASIHVFPSPFVAA